LSYRPICDTWILARPQLTGGRRYYGAYPSGFLSRARALLGVGADDIVLHVCSGMVRHHRHNGIGRHDKTVDLDRRLKPDYCMDVREGLPPYVSSRMHSGWPAILADRPYSEDDADHYAPGRAKLPDPGKLLRTCLEYVRSGGRVGFLDYLWPRPPRAIGEFRIRPIALVTVTTGYGQRLRAFSVFEKAVK
jgi:hypothetical protein